MLGMMVTLIAGVHGYAIGYVLRKYEHSRNNWQYGQTEQRSWTSDRGGTSPAICSRDWKDPIKVLKRYGKKNHCPGRHRQKRQRES